MTTGRQIPYTLFTDPELARIGLSEREAKAQAVKYRLFKVSMEHVLRAHTLSETRGFLKALVGVDSGRILGFTAFAVDGGEIMASVQTAMMGALPYAAIREAIWCHPTLVEGLARLFSSVPLLSEHADTQPRASSDRNRRVTSEHSGQSLGEDERSKESSTVGLVEENICILQNLLREGWELFDFALI